MRTIELQSIVFTFARIEMFITDVRSRHPVLSRFVDEGQTVWTSVHLSCFRPWFLATYLVRDDEVSVGETVMLMNVSQVLDLIAQVGGSEQRTRVSLVQPIHDEGPDRWKVTAIHRIWRVAGGGTTRVVDAFDLADGTRFCDSFGDDVDPSSEMQLVADFHN